MKWFSDMKIGKKLILGFVSVAILAGVVGTVGIQAISKVDKNYRSLYEGYGVSLGYLTDFSSSYHMRRGAIKDLILLKDDAESQKTAARIKELDSKIDESLKLYEQSLDNDESRRLYNELQTVLKQYNPLKEEIIRTALANQDEKALEMTTGEGNALAQSLDKAIDDVIQTNVAQGRALAAQYTQTTQTTIITILVILLACMISAIALGIYIARSISKPLTALVAAADKIADGDLDVDIEAASKDEVGMLASSFRTMTDNLNHVMSVIISAADQVASGSKQVSDSSVTLSQGATEQASSVEQLTASLEEISSQTKQNAGNASEASEHAETAKSYAAQGNEQMKHMLRAMDDINNASNSISKIIKVIDEIAFQTNILALNAAVEAARAGQHGKGFAVVAEEVRNLAARSANAAKETTDMIEGSMKKVMDGTKIANETAEALTRIVDGVAKVAGLVNHIAVASNEQASGISQINQGIAQVAEVTQTNSATSEESAAASEELSSQAQMLKSQVSKFKLKRSSFRSSQRESEQINPDVVRLLDEMNGNNRHTADYYPSGRKEAAAAGNVRIVLSDKEFGKY